MSKYRIVSARTNYERFYPGQPLCWKAAAFAHEVNEIFESSQSNGEGTDSPCPSLELSDVSSQDSFELSGTTSAKGKREIISFGDSMEERTAVRIVADQLGALPKSVMFVPSPTPMQLIGQLHMLSNHMKFVCENHDSLDLEISADQAQQCAEKYLKRNKIIPNHSHLNAELAKLMHRRNVNHDEEMIETAPIKP